MNGIWTVLLGEFDFAILMDKIDSCERPTLKTPGPEDVGTIYYRGEGEYWRASYELKYHTLHEAQRGLLEIEFLGDRDSVTTDAWYEIRHRLPDGEETKHPRRLLLRSDVRILSTIRRSGSEILRPLKKQELENVVVEVHLYFDDNAMSEVVRLTAWDFADE